MSWMDSWSRPGKHSAVPPPLYLTQGEDVSYCRTCGRVISHRKSKQDQVDVKYCSDRCRHRKPGSRDKKIEKTIVDLLNSEPDSGVDQTAAGSKFVKGDRRIIITCDEIEQIVFGRGHDPAKTFGRKKNRASRALGDDDKEWRSVDMLDSGDSTSDNAEQPSMTQHHPRPGPRIRAAQIDSEVNGSIGGEKGWAERHGETLEELRKRQEGQRRAEEREMVRRAARRLIVFGHPIDTNAYEPSKSQTKTKARAKKGTTNTTPHSVVQSRRKCEALMNDTVVEPSFAKGDWAIRWREGV